MDSSTSLDEFHGMGLEEHKAGISNNKFVQIVKSITKNNDSVVVSVLFSDENGMLGVSDLRTDLDKLMQRR